MPSALSVTVQLLCTKSIFVLQPSENLTFHLRFLPSREDKKREGKHIRVKNYLFSSWRVALPRWLEVGIAASPVILNIMKI